MNIARFLVPTIRDRELKNVWLPLASCGSIETSCISLSRSLADANVRAAAGVGANNSVTKTQIAEMTSGENCIAISLGTHPRRISEQ